MAGNKSGIAFTSFISDFSEVLNFSFEMSDGCGARKALRSKKEKMNCFDLNSISLTEEIRFFKYFYFKMSLNIFVNILELLRWNLELLGIVR